MPYAPRPCPGCKQPWTPQHKAHLAGGKCGRCVRGARVQAAAAEPENPRVLALQDALDKQLRRYSDLQRSREHLAQAIYRAADVNLKALHLSPIPKPDLRLEPGDEEVAVPILADWQLGKVTPTYSSAECEARIARFAEKVVSLTSLQRKDHPVRKAHVWILGDIIEGVTVFPGQHWLVDSSLYRQITLDGPRILGNFLRRMLSFFDSVQVTAVIGNHGRLGRRGEYDPETNGDRMLYRIVQQIFEASGEKRISFHIPDGMGERHWYAVDRIGKYSCMLFHGDQLAGTAGWSGITLVGMQKKINGWKAGAIPEPFKDVYFGHWHNRIHTTLAGAGAARCAGTPESFNTFAQEALAVMGRPSQPLMFVSPSKGEVTAEYQVWLD